MLKKIIEKILNSKTFLISAHINLEGDALGAELATYLLLKKLKKRVTICNNDRTPSIYRFLPSSGVIKNYIENERFDVALILDCSDSSRLGDIKNHLGNVKCIINIDHHISNTFFGDINWVNPRLSSASEMVYKLCERFRIIDRRIALCLYTGVFTDTGNFTYANTTRETHRVVAELLHYNLPVHKIYENIHSLCEPSDLKFISRILSTLRCDAHKKVCWVTIRHWQEKDYDLTEVIFSIMRLLKNTEVFLIFKKLGEKSVRVNFRSRSYVDVNRIAKFFGGGGHKRASGTTLDCNLKEAQKKVISFIKRYTNSLRAK
jgi:phosphoesterase RecJ-like protein